LTSRPLPEREKYITKNITSQATLLQMRWFDIVMRYNLYIANYACPRPNSQMHKILP